MLIINGKAMLRIENKIVNPGEKKDVADNLGKKLVDAGLATAAVEPPEKAVKPRAKPRKRKAGG